MNLRKLMAGTLAMTMVVGSSITVLAEDANSATGSGTSFDHVNKEVTSVTLPTTTDVANVFNYYVDPERAINDAQTLPNGTTTVTPNDDGVYFAVPSADGSSTTYSSSSKAVTFTGKNSVDVDVTVAATVTAGDADKDITLVADETALAAATTPALLMKLNVGSDSQAITASGATAKATIAGVKDNFEVKGDGSKFVFQVKTDADETKWQKTTVQLVGKTNQKDVPTGAGAMTTPTINLTWTVGKHETAPTYTEEEAYGSWGGDGLWLAKDSSNGFSSSNLTVEVSDGGTTYVALASDKYSVSEANWVSTTWENMIEAIGAEPSGNIFIRITDGSTRYTFENI
ncbi:MAG: hypothetical protein HFG85_00870 [Dorea sp.]|jgi:hypothetical protein|nr:hypothetical protein [Coprobacillus sp.]MCI9618499.1 hypothetical protein [Dorea sp.]